MKASDLFDISFDPHILYHVSPKSFEFPSREHINAAREWSRWHANGVLGLWCSTFPNMCSPFGKHIYKITLKVDARLRGLPFGVLYKTTCDLKTLAQFQPMIDEMCAVADVLYVVDRQPIVGEVIIMNFDAIETFEEVVSAEDRKIRLGRA